MRLVLSLIALFGFGLSLGASGELGFVVVWETADEGCMIDPWGGCAAGAVPGEDLGTPSTDSGCIIDPWGGCATGR
ncbi:MAG TPA: hypothetical protein VE078_18035 [Thermoanaerobaculia bacterium]|nr:hypothetical protein [Thermoanaerobaculia bacterium]